MKQQKNLPAPTEGEFEILNIIWTLGPATVRQVHEELARKKPSQYTTTLKIMQIMSEKGLLSRDETDRSHVYQPTVQRDEVQQQMATKLMDRAFGGSAYSLLVGALGGRRTSKKELADLRKLIEDYEKGKKR